MKANDILKIIKYILVALICVMLGSIITRYIDVKKDKVLFNNYAKWSKINLILNQIDNNYVDTIDYKSFTEKTIPLIMKELDPHSIYLPPKELESATQDLSGNFDGIGIMFNVPADTAVIMTVIKGGPSEKIGLLSGDRIIQIDSTLVAGVKYPQDSLVSHLKGLANTKVNLKIMRKGIKDLLSFDIIRGKIPSKSIDVAYMINDTLGYIKLSKFARTSHDEFIKAVVPMLKGGMTSLVFDLRENSGGYLDQALLLSNEFLPAHKLIVYMKGVHRKKQEFFSDGTGICQNISLDILIDENSASSSEIFAGAMQDNDRAIIYGRRSFGKGLVQEPINFTDHSGIRLTVARYYTPTGRCIQKPFSSSSEYAYDIFKRYKRGEMTSADSIPHNDSLKYTTPKGKIVYGGGGIIPDVFVPIDTIGVTDLLINLNRHSLALKYSMQLADIYRTQLRSVKNLSELNTLLNSLNLEKNYIDYFTKYGIKFSQCQWKISRYIIMTQLRAGIARYSSLGDDAFYPIISKIDNVIEKAASE